MWEIAADGRVTRRRRGIVLPGQTTPAPTLFSACTPPRCDEEHCSAQVSKDTNSVSGKEHSHEKGPSGFRAEKHACA